MKDKVITQVDLKSGKLFVSIQRDGRSMPLLNRTGEIELWSARPDGHRDLATVLRAMDQDRSLKVVEAVRVS